MKWYELERTAPGSDVENSSHLGRPHSSESVLNLTNFSSWPKKPKLSDHSAEAIMDTNASESEKFSIRG
jgi:hypothetical protein